MNAPPSPPPPIREPDPSALTCPGDQIGGCANCQRKTHKYGSGGVPLCRWCMAAVQERWGPTVRQISTRR
ncbi:hypothetical protein [Streptomyces sp. NPDC005423]|uniref:hypothetical protein n=1 Tax=Streptomyces sp. NPDC005423 TaxID=3155343 RepID=UPI0033A5B5D2